MLFYIITNNANPLVRRINADEKDGFETANKTAILCCGSTLLELLVNYERYRRNTLNRGVRSQSTRYAHAGRR